MVPPGVPCGGVAEGQLCEADGECATDQAADNCGGFDVSPEDVKLFKKVTAAGNVPATPNFQRWYQHMAKQMEKNAI